MRKLERRRQIREREIRLQRIREERRLSRLHKRYNPNKPIRAGAEGHHLRLNKKFHPKNPKRHFLKRIMVPQQMNLKENLSETLEFIATLKHEWLHGDTTRLYLDQSSLQDISTGAAIILISEIKRCMEYASGKKKVRGNRPTNPLSARKLAKIGFYRFLNLQSPDESDTDSKMYFKIVSGNSSDGRTADDLLSHFENAYSFDSIARRRLYDALIECMDNVHTHAYLNKSQNPDLVGEWWMAGYCHPAEQLISFAFFDQGVGIPTTLKMKEDKSISQRLMWAESDMLRDAVLYGVSRKASGRRGNGLPSLKGFIDELATDGHLRVVSNRGDFIYKRNGEHSTKLLDTGLNGSLILWSVKAQSISEVSTSASIED